MIALYRNVWATCYVAGQSLKRGYVLCFLYRSSEHGICHGDSWRMWYSMRWRWYSRCSNRNKCLHQLLVDHDGTHNAPVLYIFAIRNEDVTLFFILIFFDEGIKIKCIQKFWCVYVYEYVCNCVCVWYKCMHICSWTRLQKPRVVVYSVKHSNVPTNFPQGTCLHAFPITTYITAFTSDITTLPIVRSNIIFKK